MRSIEILVVFAVAAFHLAVMSRGVGFDELVLDTEFLQRHFKEGFLAGALGIEPVGKLRAIIRLDTFNGIRETFYTVLNKLRRRIGIVFLKGFQVTETAVFINECVLAIFLSLIGSSAYQTGAGDVFDVDLNFLTGVISLFVWFGNVFGVGSLAAIFPLFLKNLYRPKMDLL